LAFAIPVKISSIKIDQMLTMGQRKLWAVEMSTIWGFEKEVSWRFWFVENNCLEKQQQLGCR